jgi:lactoylglutathione lyase
MEALGIPWGGEGPGFFYVDELCVSAQDSPAAAGKLTGRCHLAFQARDHGMVERFHPRRPQRGRRRQRRAGARPYHPGYYAAFLLDPDGNNIEGRVHGEAKRRLAR